MPFWSYPMKIEVSQLHGKTPYQADFRVYSEDIVDDNHELSGEISDQGLHVTGQILLLNRHQVMCDLHITGIMLFKCARCLKLTPYSCDYGYHEPVDIKDSDSYFDLIPCVEECLYINEPFRVLCKPDCKGICPKCGADLNVQTCQCKNEADSQNNSEIDPRMEVLKKLL